MNPTQIDEEKLYPEVFPDVELTDNDVPFCPICDREMNLFSIRQGRSVWVCINYDVDEKGWHLCPLIEGVLARRMALLHPGSHTPSLHSVKYESQPYI